MCAKNVPKKTVLDTEKLEERLDIIRNKVNRFYTGYTMPEIEISNVDFDNIANIFERINTTGTKLDVFDLTIVKMWIYQVDVKTLWDKSKSDYKRINDYDQHLKVKLGRYIMEAMSLSFTTSKSCKRKEMLNMFHTEKWTTKSFNEMWEQTSLYIDKALEHLESTKTNGFGVITPKVLPYEPMLPILASLIREIEKNFKDDQPRCYEKLNQWYWTSVFAQRFSESVAAKKTSDSKDMIEWFQDESKIPKFITDFRKQFMGIDLRDETRGAVYSGMLCILAMKGAQDLEIRVSTKMISPHIDHIFPKSQINKKSKDSILNKTWLSEETNVGTKRALMPSKYITDVVKKKYDNDKKKFLEVLSSHMISDLGYDCLLNDDYDGFLESRENEMQKEIANRIGAEIEIDDLPTQTSKDTDFTNVRMLRNLVESCKDELSWVDKYFTIKDFDILQDGTASGNVKEIKILLAKQNADEKMKSDFKRFKNEMEKTRGIECQMRVMNKEISDEIHDRYLICPNQSYNIVSGDTARRGQVGDISECARPDIERWWEASYDIFEDWNKFQD